MTISCIVIAAIVETLEQALAGAPKTAAHLPSFSGWSNYVPLVLLIIAGLAWFIGNFKKTSKSNPQTPNLSNALTRSLPHDPGTFNSVDFFRTAFYSSLQDVAANSFRTEAERARPRDRESFYLDVLTVGSLAYLYDEIWWQLYRSQLRGLLELNKKNGIVPIAVFRRFYDEAAAEFPERYKATSFEVWMKFLSDSNLLKIHPTEMVEITIQGKDFLKYLLHRGRTEEVKRL